MPYKSKASAYFSPRRKSKAPVNAKWYTKKRISLNVKLRQAIMDLLPFDVDKNEADAILHTIFDTIADGVSKDGFVTIEGFGRFFAHTCPEHYKTFNQVQGCGKIKSMPGVRHIPDRTYLKFTACKSLRRSLDDTEDNNGNIQSD
jgi:nucleoid DNA-binding protein